MKNKILILSFISICCSNLYAKGKGVNWTKDPFDRKLFVENKGQFDADVRPGEKVLYQAILGNVNAYFTPQGIIYRYMEFHRPQKPVDLKEGKEEDDDENDEWWEKDTTKPTLHYLSAVWKDANPDVKVEASEELNYSYTYPNGDQATTQARIFKKIIYRDIYPGIDIEYFFPEGKSGIKYNLTVHSGADVSLVKLMYQGAANIFQDGNGNIIVNSKIGAITEHAPSSYYQDGSSVESSFELKNSNILSFKINLQSKTSNLQSVIIDPWVTNPNFSVYNNKAYDVDYDQNGNVYVLGSWLPFQLAKFNSAGVQQWTFNIVMQQQRSRQVWGFFPSSRTLYGDFAVDRRTGTSYVTEGANMGGARVIKVNTTGNLTATYPGTPADTVLEMWRAVYSANTGQIIIGSGGMSYPTDQACALDTNMINIVALNPLNAPDNAHDICLIAKDPVCNTVYMASTKAQMHPTEFCNSLMSLPLPGLVPPNYITPDNFEIWELGSVAYVGDSVNSWLANGNGLNGMAAGKNWLYIYNADTIKKLNKATGSMVAELAISTPRRRPVLGPSGGGAWINWGGLDVDGCDNVYAGNQTSVNIYSSSFAPLGTLALTDTVYDVMVDQKSNTVYACGRGYLSSMGNPIPSLGNSTAVSQTPNTAVCKACNGTAEATLTLCGTLDTTNVTYLWSNGATTRKITGLCPGVYKVAMTPGFSSCSNEVYHDSVTINSTVPTPPVLTSVKKNPVCFGNNDGSIAIHVTSGTAPYTYQWTPGGNTTDTLKNISAGTYSVHITDANGCVHDTVIVITQPPTLVFTTTSAQPTCGNNDGSATVTNVTGGTPGYTYLWSNSQTNSAITGLAGGNFIVTVTDSAGCSKKDSVFLHSSPTPPVANFKSSPVCIGVSTNFTDLSSGPPTTWNWNFGDGNTSVVQNPTNTYSTAGTYSVTLIVSVGFCGTDTITIPVTVDPLPKASFKDITVCFNNPTVFTDGSTGNNTISTWDWNFGDGNTSAQQNPSHTYNAPGTYTTSLVVTNNFGCKDSIPMITVVNPLPTANFSSAPVCLGASTCFNDLSSVAAPNTISGWSWNFGDAASGANNISNMQNACHTFSSAGTFTITLTATSSNNCQSTTVLTTKVNPLPTAQFTNSSPCLGATTSLTDGSTSNANDPITTWNWTMASGNPTSATSQNTSTSYNTAGTHTVNLIVTTKAGCKDTFEQQVLVHNIPIPNFIGSGAGCTPLCVTNFRDSSTSADGQITTWAWNFPGASPSFSNVQNPSSICYNKPGSYGASLIVTNSFGCKDSIKITPLVKAYAWPKADFCVAPLQAPATDPVFNFCDQWSQDVVKWGWNFGDNDLDSASTNPAHSYSATATQNDFYNYNVCLKVQNQHGCWDTICKNVELIPEFEFYIPNTFTPNGDGMNEFFFGKCRGVKEYNIWVFDRWGNQLWDCHKEDKNTNWDGTGQDGLSSFCKWDGVVVQGGQDMSGNSGTMAQEDVYVWKVKLTDIFEKHHDYIGHVNIVK